MFKINRSCCSFDTPSQFYVLVEVECEAEATLEKAMELFETCMENGWVEDGAVSQSSQQATDFWRLREDISEATSPYEPYKTTSLFKYPKYLLLTEMDGIFKRNTQI